MSAGVVGPALSYALALGGPKPVIGSDVHATEHFDFLRLGVITVRCTPAFVQVREAG